MSDEQNQQVQGPDPRTILCRVVDVDTAMQTSFKRFVDEQKASLEDFSNIVREELSKMELFLPQSSLDTAEATAPA